MGTVLFLNEREANFMNALFLIFLPFFAGCVSSAWVDTPVDSEGREAAIVSDAKSVLPMKSILIFPVQIAASSAEIGIKFQTQVYAELIDRFETVPGLRIKVLTSGAKSAPLKLEDPLFWQEQGRKHQVDGILVIVNQNLYEPDAGDKVVEYLILNGQGNPQSAWRVLLFAGDTGKKVWDRPFVGGVSSLTGIGVITSNLKDTLSPIAKAIAKSWPLDPDQWALGEEGWIGPFFEQEHYLKRGIAGVGVSESKMTMDPAKFFKNQFPLNTKNLQYTVKFHKSEKHQFLLQWFAPSGEKIREHEMNMTGWDMGIEMDILHLGTIKPEDKEGFWTVKLWEGQTLIDHRRFLMGSAMRLSQPVPSEARAAAIEQALLQVKAS